MEKEKAQKVVELIAEIAKGEATILSNIGWGSAEKADHNRKIVEKQKKDLVDLLTI